MTQKNPYLINTKLPETSTVSYYDVDTDQNLTFEEWNKLNQNSSSEIRVIKSGSNFRSEKEGYGPCKNTLCGCFCSKDECDCRNPEGSIYKKNNWKVGNATASGGIGWGGHSISGDVDVSAFRKTWQNADLKVGTVSAGGYAVDGGLGYGVRASADVMSFKADGVELRAGFNLDTGAGITDDGIEVKFLGAGITIGKKLEISTPAGGVACVIQ